MQARKATLLLTTLLLIAALPLLPQTATRAQEPTSYDIMSSRLFSQRVLQP